MENVKQLHETKSPHDLVIKGKVFHFKLLSKRDHSDIIYYIMHEFKSPIGDLQQMQVIYEECVHVKWWHKFFNIREEKLVEYAIKRAKTFIEETANADKRGEDLLRRIAELKQ